jgi:hypothetical protein
MHITYRSGASDHHTGGRKGRDNCKQKTDDLPKVTAF